MQTRKRISVTGIVQGVGYRPHVFRLAQRHRLSGTVRNTLSGVEIEVQGADSALERFQMELEAEAPPLAKVISFSTEDIPCLSESGFTILTSESGKPANTLVSPDIATCPDCLHELLDTSNRRFGYPFINCTNCGPRFTILRQIPYERVNTSMHVFQMCPACQMEYDDPLNRRFHAQPNACWECGPQFTLLDERGDIVEGDPVASVIKALKDGCIVAIKGLGGFHLSVDAMNEKAVIKLRQRKHRWEKPLAVMTADMSGVQDLCIVRDGDHELLESPQRPIVLMCKRTDTCLPDAIAPGNPELGVFLPYTPLQHLLFARGDFAALVMTSANLTEEPICIDNDEALQRLQGIADFFLVHNRDILLRCDDSVQRSIDGLAVVLRRSRGFVPVPVSLGCELPAVLAVGGELKNAVCITKGEHAFLGQHIGDIQNLSSYNFFEESIASLEAILEWKPQLIAHDLHPAYLSTQWALKQEGVQTIGVQHHHAHIASCMAENRLEQPVIGVALDGTGYGVDGHIWGGEVIVADFHSFSRVGHLEYVPMPGGEQAIREPWRMALAHLVQAGSSCMSDGLKYLNSVPRTHLELIQKMTLQRTCSPLTSSCGRLFDGVTALIGLRSRVSFEAQAAIELEALCGDREYDAYEVPIRKGDTFEIQTGPLFEQIVQDLKRGVSQEVISGRFHQGVIAAFAEIVQQTAIATGIQDICLSGGCFLNSHLTRGLSRLLRSQGLRVHIQTQVPCGDGGLSLGQAVIAAHSGMKEAFQDSNLTFCDSRHIEKVATHLMLESI